MNSTLLAIAASAVLLAATLPARAAGYAHADQIMKPVKVELPGSSVTAFPPGPGVDTVNSQCIACHSPGMVLRQPPMTFDQWKAITEKMHNMYGAPIAGDDIVTVAKYLTSINGPKPAAESPAEAPANK